MMSQTVAELLADHVRLTVEGIDRMYLNVYVPRLQCAYGAVSFFRDHRGQPLPSSALMSPMSRRFVAVSWTALLRGISFLSCCFAKASAKTM